MSARRVRAGKLAFRGRRRVTGARTPPHRQYGAGGDWRAPAPHPPRTARPGRGTHRKTYSVGKTNRRDRTTLTKHMNISLIEKSRQACSSDAVPTSGVGSAINQPRWSCCDTTRHSEVRRRRVRCAEPRAATILIIAAVASARPSDEWEPEGHSHTEHTKPYHVTVVKKIGVPIPHPVAVSVPQYVKIPIPQPYPVHVTVEQPIHVPVYKVVPQVVEKPVPYTVEKPVPYEVEKPYPVEVEKKVEVPIPKPYPVHVPVYKHIYHHKGGKH
ncbi:hypothetical protein RR46_13304 [Papilio xuthus]|uniref:Zinc finger protein 512B n=1 Tax=Papilio xuthus TaxID=66420 RepID=A0A194PGD0_PAPXU|nr:hypothetical protein RR46_13304 [Papilio xuthus]